MPATPITCLDVSFFCFPSRATPDGIRAIALLCSNGQALETKGWRQGQWLPFVNGETGNDEQLKIKDSDCPVTITLHVYNRIKRYGKKT